MSKADEGQLAPRRSVVHLRPIVEEIAADLDIDARARELTIRTSLEAETLYADQDLLRRTLANLVENAIRYAPAGSTVSVSSARAGSATLLRVADAGLGVPEDMRERIFSPFVQIESGERTTTHTSRGLGLTFCKVVVEAHGGRIWIEDGDPGAVFCASFPDAP